MAAVVPAVDAGADLGVQVAHPGRNHRVRLTISGQHTQRALRQTRPHRRGPSRLHQLLAVASSNPNVTAGTIRLGSTDQ
jgi:hypothetical protein